MNGAARLPRSLSHLVRVGLVDLGKAERDDRYRVSMVSAAWHSLHDDGRTVVCFAGCVMAFSLGAPVGRTMNPYQFGGYARALRALNHLRSGEVVGAALAVRDGVWPAADAFSVDRSTFIPHYDIDPGGFHAAMNELAHDLEAHDL